MYGSVGGEVEGGVECTGWKVMVEGWDVVRDDAVTCKRERVG